MDKLAAFAATTLGKWIVGAAEAGLGAALLALVSTIPDLGLPTWEATTLGAILGSIAGRLGIPMPSTDESVSP